ncbi:CDP-diacylglycerol--serine O-phosphatidyltransferase [Campylobacter insulaenigrae]|uniref:CDP-diacylglycerol--serine O-phosphatidyltransferase n=1 Tax=Campylobacter insulaenigrae NCTC 12927 TaxID=1031564 RepID=A0A0A8H2I3_9BACT|nr:CDP-diacylglycerol--serine O-phosphatidyltransferase [Campylobacter insulaenigrae]AJC88187.1 phosphatidylserine synthase [Campylobacter insulaenigrae NCTC 12927]MCR6570919.1 CDP-diacylglycerol--serine O-phosphatidyltransferase [Campylobacter insulaenigrae]MCR6572422.1 CDP-diacylglycerol--serine O-phosphatidyltransferase [Campylobacter insulaenigrae]MCR6573821.1 CDP-diacylglycerol--serine O-phosphatidyltransferase [Campylobacter insulaenigrae]MCR6575113.1 CDP-diacylglycerol--serine O-phospha
MNFKLIYILPNLFTAASVFLGIISIIASINQNFDKALIYIILSLICDGLDGRVARATNSTSKFGIEFDSLADIIAFGVAPAILFYMSIGYEYGKLGSLIAGLFVVFGAIRLARFNVTTGTYEPSVFIGLPIPTAAIVSALWVSAYLYYDFLRNYSLLILCIQALLAFLMVSNIRYPSFKKIDLKRANVLKVLIILVILLSMFYLYFLESALILASLYVLYGLLRSAYTLTKTLKKE